MTPKERADSLRRTADAIEADVESKPWQFRFIGEVKWRSASRGQEIINLDHQEYRPTPEYKLRPWTRKEVPLGCKVISEAGTRAIIITVSETSVYIGGFIEQTFEELKRRWKQLDTSEPCGVYEEGE